MDKNVVRQKSFDFALRIVETYKYLSKEKKEFVLSKQMLRSELRLAQTLKKLKLLSQKPNFPQKFRWPIKRHAKQVIG